MVGHKSTTGLMWSRFLGFPYRFHSLILKKVLGFPKKVFRFPKKVLIIGFPVLY